MTAKEVQGALFGAQTTVDEERQMIEIKMPQKLFNEISEWCAAMEDDRDCWRKTANATAEKLQELHELVGRFVSAELDAKACHEKEMEAFKRRMVAQSEIVRLLEHVSVGV